MHSPGVCKEITGSQIRGATFKGNVGGLNLRPEIGASQRRPLHPDTIQMGPGSVSPHRIVIYRPPNVANNASSGSQRQAQVNVIQKPSDVPGNENVYKSMCRNCGIITKPCNCQSQKPLPDNVNQFTKRKLCVIKRTPILCKQEFYGKKLTNQLFPGNISLEGIHVRQPVINTMNKSKLGHPPKKKLAMQEPVCLTISSDDEDDAERMTKEDACQSVDNPLNQSKSESGPDSPMERSDQRLSNPNSPSLSHGHSITYAASEASLLVNVLEFQCRSVRIGSFKIGPTLATVSRDGLSLLVPTTRDETEMVNLKLLRQDIVEVICSFNRSMPTLFVYATPGCATAIRSRLRMISKQHSYFDPGSKDESQKRLTLLPIELDDAQRAVMKVFLGNMGVMKEINKESANEILVRSTSSQVHSMIDKMIYLPPSYSEEERKQVTPKKMMTYPPPPETGGIDITDVDFNCLLEGEFLNDVIIDFYLKYLYQKKLSEVDRQKTHIFSSFFYRRLSQRPPRRYSMVEEVKMTPAESRHSRVKTWTRHVDIFEKDFIIIPLNEHSHWFLAVICFPHLIGQNEQEETSDVATDKTNSQMSYETESSMDTDQEDSEGNSSMNGDTSGPVVKYGSKPCVQPCILIFDSLVHSTRTGKIVNMLREYLKVEWNVKKVKTDCSVDDKNFVGARSFTHMNSDTPKVPQQSNFSDCGVFLLQYVESFFQDPIEDYSLPIVGLEEWFSEETIGKKRSDLRNLITTITLEQHGEENTTKDSKVEPRNELTIQLEGSHQSIWEEPEDPPSTQAMEPKLIRSVAPYQTMVPNKQTPTYIKVKKQS